MNAHFFPIMMTGIVLSTAVTAQVGINTNTPHPDADLELGSGTKALLLNRIADTSAIPSPVDGMIVYDMASGCIRCYADGGWSRCMSSPAEHISALDCSGATHAGTLYGGSPASGVSSTVAYTGGNEAPYNTRTIASTGVTGLTATLAAGTLANGNGTLTYTISGTPSGPGTASFAISMGGQSCILNRTVSPLALPASITLAQNKTYIITSVYDQDYLPYTAPTGTATTSTQAADGTNEAAAINIQGSINSTGVLVSIPVTATGSGTLPAYTTTINIPASLTEDGMSRDMTFSWGAQAYTAGTTAITATIQAVGGTLNAKKLDINAGVGNDALGVLLGTFTYPYNSSGTTTSYAIRAMAPIPDKMFNAPDNGGSTTSHRMVYGTTMAEDGKVWLNNNLGADYANISNASFNPAQQATSATDYHAYGNLFQWGRKPDGHETISWSNATTGTPANGTTTTNSDNPTDRLFIIEPNSPYDWRITQNNTLWATEASANNPCPKGFRVPTLTELNNLVMVAGITNSATAAGSALKFAMAGNRDINGAITGVSSNGYYWSSSVNGTSASRQGFFISSANTFDTNRTLGFPVRCIKN